MHFLVRNNLPQKGITHPIGICEKIPLFPFTLAYLRNTITLLLYIKRKHEV